MARTFGSAEVEAVVNHEKFAELVDLVEVAGALDGEGLERLSESFASTSWEVAKSLGLSRESGAQGRPHGLPRGLVTLLRMKRRALADLLAAHAAGEDTGVFFFFFFLNNKQIK
jgi:hypothetical protein